MTGQGNSTNLLPGIETSFRLITAPGTKRKFFAVAELNSITELTIGVDGTTWFHVFCWGSGNHTMITFAPSTTQWILLNY